MRGGRQAGPRKKKHVSPSFCSPSFESIGLGQAVPVPGLAAESRSAATIETYSKVRYDTIRCDVSRSMRHLDELASFTLPMYIYS